MNNHIQKASQWLQEADAILISASNGLSIAEGYHIFADNEAFKKYFGYFREKYKINCLIQGVFAQFPEKEQYMQRVHKYLIEDYSGSLVLKNLLELVGDKEYFVVTSNADTHFQMNGFDPERLYEIEGNLDGTSMYSEKWKEQKNSFQEFLHSYFEKRLIILELGIGIKNTMIKKPLMDMVAYNPSWKYITLNMPSEIYVPEEIQDRSIPLPGDIAGTFDALRKEREQVSEG